MGLNQGDGLKEFIQGSKAPRHDHKTLRILHKHDLAHKEIIEVDILITVNIGVVMLLKRQVDIQSHRSSAGQVCSLISCFYDPGTPSGNYSIAVFHDLLSNLLGEFIIGVIRFGPGRSEDGNTGANPAEFFISSNEFSHDLENRPGVIRLDFVPTSVFSFWSHMFYYYELI